MVGARRFLLPFFKSAQQPSTQYALSLSLMILENTIFYIKEITTPIMLQILLQIPTQIRPTTFNPICIVLVTDDQKYDLLHQRNINTNNVINRV